MPLRHASRLALALALAAPLADAAAQPGRAQDPATDHQGFYIGFGLGPGRLMIDCRACGVPDATGAFGGGTSGGFQFGMGGAIRPNVLLGGEVGAWVTSSSAARSAGLANVAFVAQVYPRPRSGLFVRTGMGVGAAILEDERMGLLGESALTSTGFTIKGGVGYDFRFGGSFGLAPFVEYVQLFAQGDERLRGVTVDRSTASVAQERYVGPPNPGSLQAGLSFNWY